jgi:DNA-binding protein HU-beta
MNKQELVDAIAAESGLSKKDSKEALDALVKTVGETLKKGDNISLVGFGSFTVIQKAARTGKNPQTGKPIQIAAKKAVKFRPGKELAEGVN